MVVYREKKIILGMFTLMPKKTLPNFGIVTKILVTCQNFGRISYIVTKIWQQTKCSHFFLTLSKLGKVENGIKVNKP